jgi:type I restriction enzyme S subunit
LAEVDAARQAAQGAAARCRIAAERRLLQAAFDRLVCAPTTLGCILNEIQTGKSFLTAEVLARPDELGVLKVSAVSWAQFRADQAKALKGEYAPAENHRVKQDDLLISRANTRELVGAVVLVERDYPMRLLSDKTLRLVVDESRANKDYLLLALRTELARKHIELYATGTSDSMRNISQDVIASIPILLPPLDDQRHIVARLKSQLDETDNMAFNRLPRSLPRSNASRNASSPKPSTTWRSGHDHHAATRRFCRHRATDCHGPATRRAGS